MSEPSQKPNSEPEIVPSVDAAGADKKQSVNRQQVLQAHYEYTWQAPLPPPEMLVRYNDAFPGCAERIVSLTERQSQHRQSLERVVVQGNVSSEKRGSWQAFCIAIVVLLLGSFLIWSGHTTEGSIFVGADLASLVGVFITGKVSQRQQLKERKNSIENAVERSQSKKKTDTSTSE